MKPLNLGIVGLGKLKGLIIMPFQNRRFDGDFLAAKLILDKKIVGDLIEIECHHDYFKENDNVIEDTRVNSFVYGHAVHLVDRLVSLFCRPNKVFYDVRNVRNVRAGQDIGDYHDTHLFMMSLKPSPNLLTLPKSLIHSFLSTVKKTALLSTG